MEPMIFLLPIPMSDPKTLPRIPPTKPMTIFLTILLESFPVNTVASVPAIAPITIDPIKPKILNIYMPPCHQYSTDLQSVNDFSLFMVYSQKISSFTVKVLNKAYLCDI